jgi:hypothetical protein
MPPFIKDEHKFWQQSPAAVEIFAYLRENPEVSAMQWGFDHGDVSYDRRSTCAFFSCVSISGWGRDELTISANLCEDGTWRIKHAIEPAA